MRLSLDGRHAGNMAGGLLCRGGVAKGAELNLPIFPHACRLAGYRRGLGLGDWRQMARDIAEETRLAMRTCRVALRSR